MSSNGKERTPRLLQLVFWLTLLLIAVLVSYRIYLVFHELAESGVHARQLRRIQEDTAEKPSLHFSVVGNIENSVGLFEQQMLPLLNQAAPDFVISAGNAVGGGGEDRYRALERTLGNLEMPYLLTVGENESSVLGSFNFYEYYGPYFYAFHVQDIQFLFLDSSDPDAYGFQLDWLQERLQNSAARLRFVFIGQPLFAPAADPALEIGPQQLENRVFRDQLHKLFREHGVTAVFSGNLPIYDSQTRDGIQYVITGGAGGLVLNTEHSFYHYVDVAVDSADVVDITVQQLDIGQHRVLKTIEGIWFLIHAFFYTSYVNFLLVVGILLLLAIKLYSLVFVEPDYYRNYDLDLAPYLQRRVRVAMVTNNYLPFIGGVPISIERLRRGLEQRGHTTVVIAPRYRQARSDSEGVVRLRSLLRLSAKSDFRLANIFSPRFFTALRSFRPDIVHIHHPFWLGWVGLLYARILRVPAVLTYHTRLEHYSHFVPLPGPLFRNLISHLLVRRFANRCSGVIVPTESARDYVRMIGVRSRIFVQPTGIEYERFQQRDTAGEQRVRERLGIAADEAVLVSVSRLSREKNIDFIVDAMAELRRRSGLAFRCVLIGDGDERERLEQRIRELELSDYILLAGPVAPDEMPLYYRMADIFVFASTSETQGMVILEAMAAGLPVVAVRSSGIDDVISHERTGFKTIENIHPWIEAVEQLLADTGLREAMGRDARAFAAGYAVAPFADSIAAAYAEVLAVYES